MKKLFCALLCILLLGAAGASLAQSEEPGALENLGNQVSGLWQNVTATKGELSVGGRAVRTVAPDTATLRLGVQKKNADEQVAQQEATEVMTALTAALRALGIPESDMKTSRYNISSVTTGTIVKTDQASVNILLTVTLRDLSRLDAVLQAGADAGVNDVREVSFSVSNEGEIYREALRDAVEMARLKAEIMAEGAGVKISAVLEITENQAYSYASYASLSNSVTPSSSGGGSAPEALGGEIEITASVSIRFEVQ